MSLAEDAGAGGQAALRALAHPIRLRMLSLLTDAELTAAEIARELAITHANASYHLRNLLAGGVITAGREEKIRGGLAKRYRYVTARDSVPEQAGFEGWVDPAIWQDVRKRIAAALRDLHDAARPPGEPGTIRASATVALFDAEAG
jgi:DNA-binding transcriptional ArsR family regulator